MPADHEPAIAAARRAVEAEQRAQAAWRRALEERDSLVRSLYAATADDMSQNELARRIGLTGSTLRAITPEERRAHRARTT